MRILISSGGTKIPIDSVRSITNMSRGTFGAKLAEAAMIDNNVVYFVTHKDGRTPVKLEVDLKRCTDDQITKALAKMLWIKEVSNKLYFENPYDTFTDYEVTLGQTIRAYRPDAVVLAAAVSDYGVKNKTDGKIRSGSDMNIELTPLPKIINKIRGEWAYKGILVGFKLMVGATDKELLETAHKSAKENGCDFVVANDLNDLKRGDHKVMIVTYDGFVQNCPKNDAIQNILNKIYNIYMEQEKLKSY